MKNNNDTNDDEVNQTDDLDDDSDLESNSVEPNAISNTGSSSPLWDMIWSDNEKHPTIGENILRMYIINVLSGR